MKKITKLFEDVLNSETPYVSKKAPHFKIKPSDLGSPCMRKIFYSSGMVERDYDFDILGKKRMALGDAIHDMLKKVLGKSGALINYYNPDGSFNKHWKTLEPDYEFPLRSPELFVESGKIDAVMIIDGKLWIAEFKSINARGFAGLVAPKPDHLIQGCTYYFVFNQYLAEGKFAHIKELAGFTKAEGVIYLYVNKDDTEMKEFETTELDVTFQRIVAKIYQAKENYDNQVLPPKTQDYCYSCPWRDKCAKNQLK